MRSKARSSPRILRRAQPRSASIRKATANSPRSSRSDPAMRGTALRDSLDFVSFNDFKNQIDYAQFGKAFNQYAVRTVLSDLPRESLVGRERRRRRRLHARSRRSASARHTRAIEDWTGVVTEAQRRRHRPAARGRNQGLFGHGRRQAGGLRVRRGAVNVLVGENGAGKSTLMKIIAGVECPTVGSYPARRQARRVRRQPPMRRRMALASYFRN